MLLSAASLPKIFTDEKEDQGGTTRELTQRFQSSSSLFCGNLKVRSRENYQFQDMVLRSYLFS